MTQKRGLGRGLGALIPGAGSTPAPEQELRTRTRPSDATEGRSSSPRPVDMFFSGEKVGESDRPQRGSAGAHDLAAGMARAAAERRGRTNGSSSARAGAVSSASERAGEEKDSEARDAAAPARGTRGTSTSGTAKKAPVKKAPTKAAPAKRAPAKKAPVKAASAKTAPAKAAPAKEAVTKSTAAQGAAATKPASQSTAAGPSDAKASGPSRATAQPAEITPDSPRVGQSQSEDSPVVDVETVASTPTKPEASATAPEPQTVPDFQDDATAASEAPAPDVSASETATAAPAQPTDDPKGPTELSASLAAAQDSAPQDEQTGTESPAGLSGTRGLVSVPGAEFAEIPIHEVRENPRNPRTMFDDDELDELAYSLREVGVLQPVVVRPIPVTEDGESFELVMGERRWRAARRAGLLAIPAIIRETSDDDLLRDALLENLHRTQLNPLEEANAYQQLLEDFGCTQDELGERIGRSRPQITNTLRLLRLPALVQRRLASGAISAGHARALLSLDNPTLMEELAQRIVQEGLSVRAVERLVARGGQETGTRTVRRTTYDPHVVDLTSRLSNRLEAPVRIDVGKRKGRITLEFSTLEDLERLVENMGLDIPLPEGEPSSRD
ncbi:ParB/RepB/Spo0J family partition protein [Brachybacterium paraconglomeratum]